MDQNMKMVKGDTLSFGVEIEGNTQDLDSAYFSCKKDIDSSDYIFRKSLNDGIWKDSTGENNVIYGVRVAPEDTEELEAGNYYYDMEIGINDDIFTILKGVLTIEKDVRLRRER